jgi:hypothetical protein
MKRTTFVMAAALTLTAAACNRADTAATNDDTACEAAAADLSALNGVWEADLASVKFEGKPDEFLVQGGTYKCNTCIPPLTLAADGQFHAVADRPYYDSMSAKVVDDRTVEFHRRKGDREVGNNTLQVSADGKSMTNKFHDATTPGSEYDGATTLRRAGAAPAGAHAISGQWMPDKVGEYTPEALRTSYRVDGNKVTSSVQGQTYVAEIDGPAVAVQNDPGKTTVAITREGAGLKETYTRDGKQVAVSTIVPNADGQSASITSSDPRDGSKVSWTAKKRS